MNSHTDKKEVLLGYISQLESENCILEYSMEQKQATKEQKAEYKLNKKHIKKIKHEFPEYMF